MSKKEKFIKNARDNAAVAEAQAKYFHKLAKWAEDNYPEGGDEDDDDIDTLDADDPGGNPPPPPPKIPPNP